MYSVNGIELTGSEYEELKLLVESKNRDGSEKDFARNRIKNEKFGREVYCHLKDKGLVSGYAADNTFYFNEITQRGNDFVKDFKSSRRRERIRTYLPPVLGGILGILGTVIGVLLGWNLGTS